VNYDKVREGGGCVDVPMETVVISLHKLAANGPRDCKIELYSSPGPTSYGAGTKPSISFRFTVCHSGGLIKPTVDRMNL